MKKDNLPVATPNDRAIATYRREAVISLFSSKNRGDFISWDDIAKICETDEREVLSSYVCLARPVLEETYGYFLINEHNRGYKIAEGDEQRQVITAQWRQALNRAFTCESRVDYVDTKSLTGAEVKMLEIDKQHMQKVNSVCRKALNTAELNRRKKHELEFAKHSYPTGRNREISG